MCTDFLNLTTENLADEHLCCIIRSRKPHQGVEAKRQWLSERLKEGHVFDRGLVNEMCEAGFNGICFPEAYGGAGGDYLSYILAVEELSKVDDGMGITLSVNVSLCAGPIMAYGTEEQKQKYLRPIAEGTHECFK